MAGYCLSYLSAYFGTKIQFCDYDTGATFTKLRYKNHAKNNVLAKSTETRAATGFLT